MGKGMIYFNNSSTTIIKPQTVYEAFICASKNLSNMGRGVSALSTKSSRAALESREAVARLFGIQNPLQVGFAKNATEALNAGITGCLENGDHVIATVCEHNSVLRPLYRMQKERDAEVTLIPCDKEGNMNPDAFRKALKKNTKMIVMTHVSNVTGSIYDIRSVGKIARDAGALFFLDAAQSAGVLDIDVAKDNIDMLAFTAHKYLFSLQGLGGLYVREGIGLKPLIVGGGTGNSMDLDPKLEMPDILEAGTQNLPGIVALQKSIEFIESNRDGIRKKESELTEYFLERIKGIPFLKLLGTSGIRNRVSLFSLVSEEYSIQDIAEYLEERYGVVVRTGAQCAPMIHRYIGSRKEGTFRVSLCFFNEKEEIDTLMEGLGKFPRSAHSGGPERE